MAVYALLAWSAGGTLGTAEDAWQELRSRWMESWTIPAGTAALALWLLSAVWRVGDFLAALVRNREGLCPPRPWAMWVSAVVSSVMVLAWIILVLGAAGDALLTGEGENWYMPVLMGFWAVFALYRWADPGQGPVSRGTEAESEGGPHLPGADGGAGDGDRPHPLRGVVQLQRRPGGGGTLCPAFRCAHRPGGGPGDGG